MMNTNYREMLNLESLTEICKVDGITKKSKTLKEKKAIRNIKYCAKDQWQFVNSWYDYKDEDARAYMMNARQLFNTIYEDSQKNVYDEGSVHFGTGAERYMKDVRFCGKEFLQKVTLYHTAKLLEESVYEVDGTEEDAERIFEDLKKIKAEIYGDAPENVDEVLKNLCTNVDSGDFLIDCVANVSNCEVKMTRKNEKWISIPKNLAIVLSQYLKSKESNLEATESRTKINFKNGNVTLILNLGTNPYLWSVK